MTPAIPAQEPLLYANLPVAAIAAVAREGAVGLAGRLPWHLPADVDRFRRLTLGHAVIFGRRTFESLGARGLPGRLVVVLGRIASAHGPGWAAAGSVEEALEVACRWELSEQAAGRLAHPAIYVGGGPSCWESLWPFVDRLELTRIDASFAHDAVFPPVDLAAFAEVHREVSAGSPPLAFLRLERGRRRDARGGLATAPGLAQGCERRSSIER